MPTRSPSAVSVLDALPAAFPAGTEIVVAQDNAAAPADGAQYRVRRVAHRGTRGFGPTCNAGARAARCPPCSSSTTTSGWGRGLLEALSPVLESGTAGAVGPDVWSVALGRSESGTRLFWRHGVLESRQQPLAGEGLVEVPYVCGAAMAAGADDFRALGGFDERLAPYYSEDVELEPAPRRRAGPAVVLSGVRVEHAHGATISREPAGRKAPRSTSATACS